MKFELVENIKNFLERKGYELFEYLRGCFDLAAKREKLLLLKVLSNIDSFQKSQAQNLKVLSKGLSASPMLLGERTRRENLKKDVVYERFGLPALHPETFKSAVRGDYPHKIRTRGGIFGKLDPERLEESRVGRGLTQEELADRLGVSQKNVSEHEGGLERASYSVVRLAETELERGVKKRINPFDMDLEKVEQEEVNKEVRGIAEFMERAGFEINYTDRAPPEIIAKESSTLLSRVGKTGKVIKKWESSLSEFSKLSETPAFFIMEGDCKSKELPVLSKEELNEIEESKELIKIVKGRAESY